LSVHQQVYLAAESGNTNALVTSTATACFCCIGGVYRQVFTADSTALAKAGSAAPVHLAMIINSNHDYGFTIAHLRPD
jgi:hypothetical protein